MHRLLVLLATILMSIASLVMPSVTAAQKFAVGTCEPKLPSFNTISAAVTSVPSGATVLVCPGNYAEQVVITQPLTLQGAQVGGSNAAAIVSPAGGIVQNATTGSGTPVGGQLVVANTGPVNISDLTIDGSNSGDSGCVPAFVIGVYYQTSSGILNHLVVRNQSNGGCSYGIVLENDGTTSSPAVTVENSSLHDFEAEGINLTEGPGAQGPTVSLLSNSISKGQIGIAVQNGVLGTTISGNAIDGSLYGILLNGSNNIVKSNRISNAGLIGIQVSSNSQIQSNALFSSGTGIAIGGSNNQVQLNSITNSNNTSAAIDLGCGTSSNTVSGNIINEASTGIANGGNIGNTLGANKYSNVTTLVGACQ